jgi:hypothetical protein
MGFFETTSKDQGSSTSGTQNISYFGKGFYKKLGKESERLYGGLSEKELGKLQKAGKPWEPAPDLEYFPGKTWAGPSATTQEGIEGLAEFGRSGGSGGAATGYANDVLRGKYLGGNPHRDEMLEAGYGRMGEAYQRATSPGISARFARSGRSQSGGEQAAFRTAQQSLALEMGRLTNEILYADYSRERGSMDRMAALVPTLDDSELRRKEVLLRAGQAEEGYEQAQISSDMERYYFEMMEPWSRLQLYGGNLPPMMPTKIAQNQYTSPREQFVYGTRPDPPEA